MSLRFYPRHMVETLDGVTSRFYREHALSFSATRSRPWDGWAELARFLQSRGWGTDGIERTVLDLACGNLRFERFLTDTLAPGAPLRFTCVDNCAELARSRNENAKNLHSRVEFCELDVVGALLDGTLRQGGCCADGDPADGDLASSGDSNGDYANGGNPGGREIDGHAGFDLSVSFGFMHHIPGSGLRAEALKTLTELTKPGGLVIVSLWRFAESPRGRAKAEREHADALAAIRESADAGGELSGTHGLRSNSRSALDGNCASALGSSFPSDLGNVCGDAIGSNCTSSIGGVQAVLGDLLDGALEPGDYLLGWNRVSGAFRYCHSFSEEDVAELVDRVRPLAHLVMRYRADGHDGESNEYLVFERNR